MRTLDPALRKHPLFNRADQNLSVEQAFEAGGLNFEVAKMPVFARIGENIYQEVPSHKFTYRYDEERVLGVVSQHYEVIQNKRGLEFLNAFFAEGGDDVKVIGSGIIRGGRRVFVSFQLGSSWSLPTTNDEFVHTLTWGNGFDGGTAFDLTFREIRMVCTNGMVISNLRSRYSVKHGSGAPKNITVTAAQNALGFGYEVSESFEKELEKLYSREVHPGEFLAIVDEILPVPEEEGRKRNNAIARREIINQAWLSNESIHGTALGAYNAFNELEQWGTGDTTAPEIANNRALHRTFVSHFNMSNRVLELTR